MSLVVLALGRWVRTARLSLAAKEVLAGWEVPDFS